MEKTIQPLQPEHTSPEPSQPKEDGNPYLQTSLTRASSKTSQSSFTPHFDRKAPTSNSYPTEQQPRNHKQPHGQSMRGTTNKRFRIMQNAYVGLAPAHTHSAIGSNVSLIITTAQEYCSLIEDCWIHGVSSSKEVKDKAFHYSDWSRGDVSYSDDS